MPQPPPFVLLVLFKYIEPAMNLIAGIFGLILPHKLFTNVYPIYTSLPQPSPHLDMAGRMFAVAYVVFALSIYFLMSQPPSTTIPLIAALLVGDVLHCAVFAWEIVKVARDGASDWPKYLFGLGFSANVYVSLVLLAGRIWWLIAVSGDDGNAKKLD
ncbi:hypothetical protein BJ742DRAFT_765491 [Cladochytrium replicatum]|nr:hypothetical protein BJ742DRAFT_765491 [Cladochytrium replicatum]